MTARKIGFIITAFGVIGTVFQFVTPGLLGLTFAVTCTILVAAVYEVYFWSSANRWKKLRFQYFSTIKSSGYILWQNQILSLLYGNEAFIDLFETKYPVFYFKIAQNIKYPFKELGSIENFDLAKIDEDKQQRAYLKILGDTVKRPLLRGFAMRSLYLDNKNEVEHFLASVCNFRQNIVTSHILEYELYKLYIEHPNKSFSSAEAVLKHLKYRRLVHSNRNTLDILTKQSNYLPLIGIQALVIFKDYSRSVPDWKIIIIKRSENVAIRPGYFQFVPAGGFEVFGKQETSDKYFLKHEFDLEKAVWRELAEEIYGKEELQYNEKGSDSDMVFNYPVIRLLRRGIKEGTVSFNCVGIVVDLVTLKHDISFLITIDASEFSAESRLGSIESDHIFTKSFCEIKTLLANGPLNPVSAGLLKLVLESRLLGKIGIIDK